MGEIFLSVIIPAFNEETRISYSLEEVIDFLRSQPYQSEIIVVVDGSTDRTLERVQPYVSTVDPTVRIIKNDYNRGKGYSVRNGILNSVGRFVLFTDADLSAPTKEIPKLMGPLLESEYDVVFGSRGLAESIIAVHQPFLRELSGRLFNWFVRIISGLQFKDTQCGFKAFRREAAMEIFESQTITGFGFDVEILYAAQKYRWRLKEVPILWRHVEGTKVKFLRDAPRMFLDLFKVRWNDLTGKYNARSKSRGEGSSK